MVEKEFQQLRFDVSENIRLHPQKPGIGTLLELDLFPDVECKDEGKQLKIEGFLRLNGAYVEEKQETGQRSESSEDEWEEISYVIPVEIILPAERADLEHISVEVESFDYNIVSPYELQITAILLIDGILPEVEEEKPEKVDLFEVIHEEPTFSAEPVMLASLSEEKKEKESDSQLEKKVELNKEEKHSLQREEVQHRTEETGKQKKPVGEEAKEEKEKEASLFAKQMDQSKEEELEREKRKEMAESLNKGNESLKVDDEKEKQPSEAEDHEMHEKALVDEQEEEAVESVKEKRKSPEWIDWLVRSREESYQPMRMVIIQRGQSIDQLADQYRVSKDRLIEANRLKTDFIDEGAILYIPEERQTKAEGL